MLRCAATSCFWPKALAQRGGSRAASEPLRQAIDPGECIFSDTGRVGVFFNVCLFFRTLVRQCMAGFRRDASCFVWSSSALMGFVGKCAARSRRDAGYYFLLETQAAGFRANCWVSSGWWLLGFVGKGFVDMGITIKDPTRR